MQQAEQPEWYFTNRGQQHGPVTATELAKLGELGHLAATDYVWRDGFANWVAAGELDGLLPRRRPPPVPPPPHAPIPLGPEQLSSGPYSQSGPYSGIPASVAEVTAQLARATPARSGASYAGPGGQGVSAQQPRSRSAASREPSVASTGVLGNSTGAFDPSGHSPAAHKAAGNVASEHSGDTTTALIAYILLIIVILPLLPLIGFIVALVNRSSAPDWLATHYRWQIRTFLIGVLYAMIGVVLSVVLIGVLVLIFAFIWTIVRYVKGISALNRREPIANVATWLW